MSIEKALADLQAAVEENTSYLKVMTGAASKVAEGKAAEGKATRSRSTKDDDDKGDEKPAARGRGRAKKVTVKEVLAAAEKYLDVDDDEEYEERKSNIKQIAKRLKATKLSEIEDADDLASALKMIETVAAGENLDEDDDKGSRRRGDDL